MLERRRPRQPLCRRHARKGRLRHSDFLPVVAQGKARIRTQISAAHTREDLEFAIAKFSEAKAELSI